MTYNKNADFAQKKQLLLDELNSRLSEKQGLLVLFSKSLESAESLADLVQIKAALDQVFTEESKLALKLHPNIVALLSIGLILVGGFFMITPLKEVYLASDVEPIIDLFGFLIALLGFWIAILFYPKSRSYGYTSFSFF